MLAALAALAAFSAMAAISGCGSDGSSDGGAAGKTASSGSGGEDGGRGGTSGAAGAASGAGGRVGSAGYPAGGEAGGGDIGGRPAGGSGGASGAAGHSGSGGSNAGGAPTDLCPATAPANGASCTVGYQCVYYDCDGAGQVNAFCNGSKVSTEVLPCGSIACGAVECEPGSICVEHMGGMSAECQENPCNAHALSCGCASGLCDVTEACSVSAGTVHCNQ
jgi:hypothetical protein